ncbi:putative acylesterase/phospholipase RssA [Mucilaginibacter sp. OAE612]|uniref:patatin-like phospholipase family protein n=1 Tax=Mucilaginibacter sp. OAE612 TaxID=3156444 RepID=UPI00359DB307
MSNTKISTHPLEKIDLSCSGGGYRAASYHLGAMSYLNRLQYRGKPLLENVKMISTVSGGTITGIVYALGKAHKDEFETIFNFLISQLKQLDLVKAGISQLNPDAVWANTAKSRNLVNAFALQYDEHLTRHATIADLDLSQTHLEAAVFNTTEFTNAVDFRFRNKGAGYCGNFYLKVDAATAAETRLGDVMAASSCFPGGFEPILWPQDFVHEQAPRLKALAAANKPTGLMDGGIYDNQGISSILNYRKNDAEPYFDLIIVSDVASPYMEAYQPVPEAAKTGFYKWTLKDLATRSASVSNRASYVLLGIVLLGLIIPVFTQYRLNFGNGLSLGFAAAALILWIGKVLAVKRLRAALSWTFDRLTQKIPGFYRDKLAHLHVEDLSLHRIEPLALNRLVSLVDLLMNVFLKVVRRLNYNILYHNPAFDYRRIGNLIKQLTEEDFVNSRERLEQDGGPDPNVAEHSVLTGTYQEVIGPELQKISEEAASFGTTLWFTDQDVVSDMLDKLIITGQATMCYNLVEYLEQLIYTTGNGFAALPSEGQQAIQETYDQCKTDWKKFREAPGFMLKPGPQEQGKV